jgi:hypothetical protein
VAAAAGSTSTTAPTGEIAELLDHEPGDRLVLAPRQVEVDGAFHLVEVHVAAITQMPSPTVGT